MAAFRLYFRTEAIMGASQKKALSAHRRRLKRSGIARLEVRVHKDDVALVRSVVAALTDPDREAETRALLRDRFGTRRRRGLKELLAAAPLEGIELTRDRDLGRDVDL
jgi:plasmid stability protein